MTDESTASKSLQPGDDAPAFSAPAVTRDGEVKTLSSERLGGKTLVLYFYPKDETPGCTAEACSFRDLHQDFEAAGGELIGVSPDTIDDHILFAQRHMLPFPLLADPDHAIAEAYGAWREKVNYGKRYMGIERSTFVVGRDGKIAKVYPRVKVDEHARKVLEYVRTLAPSV